MLTLRDAGFDAFVSDEQASLKSGVAVRVNRFDSRVRWSGLADELAPLDYAFTERGGKFVLHAGRVEADGDTTRLTAFVTALTSAAVEAQLQAA